MATWLVLLAAALVLAFVVRPLARGADSAAALERAERGRLRDLLAAKEAAYAAIKEIEFDHLTRKLDDHDFEILRARYRAHAVALLKEIDALESAGGPGRRNKAPA